MSATRTAFLGTSSTEGKNLTNPTTERYEALFRTYIQGARSSHCRTAIYALAGLGLYDQQATGFSIPANRQDLCAIDTARNITAALTFKPHVLILHHEGCHLTDGCTTWGYTTEIALKGFFDSEIPPLVANIAKACADAGVLFRLMGLHPLVASVRTSAEIAANINVVRKYAHDALSRIYSGRFIDYWSSIDDGTGNADASKMLADGHHCNTTGLAFVEAALEVAGLATLNNKTTPLDIDP